MTTIGAFTARAAPAGFDSQHILRGFEHVKRFWEPALGHMTVKILPGEFYATTQHEVISTVLGSCVSACVRDCRSGIGGMNHFLLPEPVGRGSVWGGSQAGRAARYGSDAMEQLINAVLKAGGERSQLEVKIFGGGRVLTQMSDVGRRNIDFVRRYLDAEGFALSAEDVGDVYPRHVRFFPWSGKVHVKRLRSATPVQILDRERSYLKQLANDPIKGEVELF